MSPHKAKKREKGNKYCKKNMQKGDKEGPFTLFYFFLGGGGGAESLRACYVVCPCTKGNSED